MNLQLPVDQVDDPVFREGVAGVQVPLAGPVRLERRLGHLDDQRGQQRMLVENVPRLAFDDGHVGLRFGLRPKSQR